jgi:hypothetical protein
MSVTELTVCFRNEVINGSIFSNCARYASFYDNEES